ncbi:MAG: hypothetical protein D6683_17860 [Actinomyces sp.]|nr:MAG: hypothetical protein D6683_17860 [Actinomyces sp.]
MTTPPDLSSALERLTLADLEELEDAAGVSIDDLFGDGAPRAKMLRASAFVVGRSADPDFTWDDAGRWTLADVVAAIGDQAEADPQAPSGASTGS